MRPWRVRTSAGAFVGYIYGYLEEDTREAAVIMYGPRHPGESFILEPLCPLSVDEAEVPRTPPSPPKNP